MEGEAATSADGPGAERIGAGHPLVVTGHPGTTLATDTAELLGVAPVTTSVARFPDGELEVRYDEPVGERDLYVVCSTGPPVHEHLAELCFLLDAARRAGARRRVAVVPYYGYARQDRRTEPGGAMGAPLVGALLAAAGATRIVVVHPHVAALEAMAPVPLDRLDAVPHLADALRARLPPEPVVVAPDLGAAKLAERYARVLDCPAALVTKERISGTSVRTRGVTGEVAGRTPVIVDDMIATGGTIVAAYEALVAAGSREELVVCGTHGLFVGDAPARLVALPLRELVTTDTVAGPSDDELPRTIVTVAGLIADAIRRIHEGQRLDVRLDTT